MDFLVDLPPDERGPHFCTALAAVMLDAAQLTHDDLTIRPVDHRWHGDRFPAGWATAIIASEEATVGVAWDLIHRLRRSHGRSLDGVLDLLDVFRDEFFSLNLTALMHATRAGPHPQPDREGVYWLADWRQRDIGTTWEIVHEVIPEFLVQRGWRPQIRSQHDTT